ncbi:hypothetical protein MTR67_013648 [Solanum verrucosum]|uniref:Uncharacterized protein n=1 Tax=Solanum verrucosum TaxID=315347 RepID=A0AAF0QBV3_SOLVR|nr:hypothetical protein MTR67_013648 [Solanum verrucosum]
MFMNEHEHAEMVDAAEDAEHHEVAKERLKRKEFKNFIGAWTRMLLDPNTNPLIDDKRRYKTQLVGEGEKGKEKMQEEQQWSKPVGKSARKVAQQNLGRIWILWDPNKVKFRVDVVHKQFIHGYVTTQSSRFYLTGVYGMHTIADRKHLWTGLTQVTNAVTKPLVIMGDFNSILHGDDRFGGNAVMDGEVQDFKKFMETASMIGMKCLVGDILGLMGTFIEK